jgi:hypothetical protein
MQVANYTSNARPQMRDAVYESLIMMKEMLQGSSQDSPSNVVETLKNAMGSSTMTASLGEPKAGPEANKQGAPRQSRLVSTTMIQNGRTKPKKGGRKKSKCKFCGATTCGNIATCGELKQIGARVHLHALGGSFFENELSLSKARIDEVAKAWLVTSEKQVLCSLPTGTKWLVIHDLYDLRATASPMTQILQESQTGVEVSCIGEAGVTIDLGNGMYFGNRMASCCVVRNWIASAGKRNVGKTYSRVILSHNFNGILPMNDPAAFNMQPTKEAAVQ